MKDSLFATLLANARLTDGLVVSDERLVLYPVFDVVSKECRMSVAFVGTVQDGGHTHTVVVSYGPNPLGESEFSVWCADRFLEARNVDAQGAKARCDEAAKLAPAASQAEVLSRTMLLNFGTSPQSGPCNFWSNWRNNKVLCSHTSHVLALLRDTRPDFQDEIKRRYNEAVAFAKA